MPNTNPSPNMGLPVPTVGVDPGPDWATNYDACLSIIDGHDHAPGSGVQITPNGLDINSDLTFQNNNATNLRSARFYPQASPPSTASDLGCLYESGVDLWYNDGNGNQIRLTSGGSIVGTAGSITGLPSGTAGVSYSAGTYTFVSATNTPATLDIGPLVIGNATVGSDTVTIQPNTGISGSYSLFLPTALPSSTSLVTLNSSGDLATTAFTSGVFVPTISYLTNVPASVSLNSCNYLQIGTLVIVDGVIEYISSATAGGTQINQIGIPVALVSGSLLISGGIYTETLATGVNTSYVGNTNNFNVFLNQNGDSTTNHVCIVMYHYTYQIG